MFGTNRGKSAALSGKICPRVFLKMVMMVVMNVVSEVMIHG